MKAKKTQKESSSRTLQSKLSRGRVYIEDNRAGALSLTKMVGVAQAKEKNYTQLKQINTFSLVKNRPLIQRMTVRTTPKNATIDAKKFQKHVVENEEDRESKALACYSDSTFVDDVDKLYTPVNNNPHNFTELTGVKSARFDFNANVKIYQYEKNDGNLGVDNPVTKVIDNIDTPCTIGVIKTGTDEIKITHFQKNGDD